MKPPKWDLSIFEVIAPVIFHFFSVFLFFLSSFAFATENSQTEIVKIRQARYIVSDATMIPEYGNVGWNSIKLPHKTKKPNGSSLVGYWYSADFDLINNDAPSWLYLARLPSGGRIFINGKEIDNISSANALINVRWYRPHLLFIPPMSLRLGSNSIAIKYDLREPLTSFGVIEIGPEKPLRKKYDLFLLIEDTSAKITSAICIFASGIFISFWFRRRQETIYGLYGVCILFWGIRTFLLKSEIISIENLFYWRFFYYMTTAVFIVTMTLFILRYCKRKTPDFDIVLVTYAIIGCTTFLTLEMQVRPILDSVWLPGFIPFILYAVFQLFKYTKRNRTYANFAMCFSILIAFGLVIHDLAIQMGCSYFSEIYVMHLGMPIFLFTMIVIFLDHFIRTLFRLKVNNEIISVRVREREDKLLLQYDRIRKLAKITATSNERQRIMQEMHDGVGSQLLMTLAMVQRGASTQRSIVLSLQDCLDDIRITIEALTPDEPDILPILGNFRFRMESRFKAIGISLNWHNYDLPDSFELAPYVGLQLIRILQEAISNVLKHSHAKAVDINVYFSEKNIRIIVRDDGSGFSINEKNKGMGLINMRIRAKKINAILYIDSSSFGTTVQVELGVRNFSSQIFN